MQTPHVNLRDHGGPGTQKRSTGRRKRTPCVHRGEWPTNGLHLTPRGLHTWKPRGYRAGTQTRSPHAHTNDYRHWYTGTGVDNRTTGTGQHRKDEDGAVGGRTLTTTRRGVGTTTTNGRGGDGRERRRRMARGRLRRRSLDEGETRPAQGLTTRGRQTRTA